MNNIDISSRYRYQIDPDSASTAAKVLQLVGKGKHVLELGTAAGAMTQMLREYCLCSVVGVEIDPISAERARPYCDKLIVGNLDELNLVTELGSDRFDVVVAADVLEHLRDPWRCLEIVRQLLKPEGYLVLSIPNVAFNGLLGSIVSGSFPYAPVGMLDQTHLRFFTLFELESMLVSTGFVPETLDRQLLGVEHSEFASQWADVPAATKQALASNPEGLTYQFVMSARPANRERLASYLKLSRTREMVLSRERETALQQASGLEKELAIREKELAVLTMESAQLRRQLDQTELHLHSVLTSITWRIAAPIRSAFSIARKMVILFRLLPGIIRFGGGASGSVKKAWRVFSREGWNGVKRRIQFVGGNRSAVFSSTVPVNWNDYGEWVRRYDTLSDTDREQIKSKIAVFQIKPLISVVMPVYNPPISFLDEAIQSVRNQLYPNWELCIADDASTNPAVREVLERHCRQDDRIKVVYRELNGHISRASNSALELAQGEFIALFDHDDLLAEHALYWVADAINRHPEVALVYSDEDKIDESNQRYDPYFKCELNYELLLAQNMVCHLGVFRASLIRSIGGFREGFEGAQDYDLALRVLEKSEPEQIVHVPRVLYHWRAIAGSTALAANEKNYAAEAGRKAVAEHLKRAGLSAEVMPAPEAPALNRVRFSCPSPHPMVSIIIPTRDRADLLGMCLDSLIQRTTYSNFEVIIIDNGSVEDATRQLFDRLPKDRFRILRDESPFNFSVLNNNAARMARGELFCLMNNDIEILTPDWLEEMASFAVRADTGCVGARLWYPDGRLQHGGCILGVGGVCGHSHRYLSRGEPGYFRRATLHQSFSAVTAACLLVRRSVFEEVGGLDEQLGVAFNDIDFCLRVREAGYRNVWTPYAEMNHHESASRGTEDTPAKQARFFSEICLMQSRWGEKLFDDPAYSPNLTLDCENFSYAWPPRVSPYKSALQALQEKRANAGGV